MRGSDVRRRYNDIIRELSIPRPFDLGQFVAGLERRRGRPIRLRPFRAAPGMPCGVWISTAEADYIYHKAVTTTPFHATHIVLHELAHMMLGHGRAQAWDRLAGFLVPGVDPALVQLILSRSAYGLAEEREAETLASLILSGTAAGLRDLPAYPAFA